MNTKRFYRSAAWLAKRAEVMRRDHYECQRCKEHGRFSRGVVVHHIKHLKDREDLALENSNLVTLCEACHNAVHPEKQIQRKSPPPHPERWA